MVTQYRKVLCSSLSGLDDRRKPLVLCQVFLAENGEPPEWIMLVPAGDKIRARDGRTFSNAEPQAVVDAFNADSLDMPIDWNHAEEKKAPKGDPAPASGWVDKMEVRAGAIWGRVEWTPKGAESLRAKESRYISPAMALDKVTRVVKELSSAGLVNSPALDMPALAHTESEKTGDAQEDTMKLKELLAMLGLPEDGTMEQAKAALDKLKADPAAELVTMKTELETAKSDLVSRETELANARNANPSLDKFVPRSDYDTVVARSKKLESDNKAVELAAHQDAVDTEIASALKSGKITPATKDFYVSTCSTKDGLEGFRKFVEAAPVIGDVSDLDKKKIPGAGDKGATDVELVIASECGLSKEDYIKSKNDQD